MESAFDASEINGFMNIGESDLLLKPDPSTAEILPWRPQQDRVLRIFCDICYPDGRTFEGRFQKYFKAFGRLFERARILVRYRFGV